VARTIAWVRGLVQITGGLKSYSLPFENETIMRRL
jgi:hypothetical protein